MSEPLRRLLHPLALGYTAVLIVSGLGEFLFGIAPLGLAPGLYLVIFAAFAGERELRRWAGRPDPRAPSAAALIYAWWACYFFMRLWLKLAPACGRPMPADFPLVCRALGVGLFALGVSRLLHRKREDARAMLAHTNARQAIMEYAASRGRITKEQCAGLLQVSDLHARRLMDQLCDDGFLEPEGGRVPHTYRLAGKPS